MLDVKSVADIVEQEAIKTVNQYVTGILADQAWQAQIENKITKFVQERIAARFANISTVAGLSETVQNSVKELFERGQIPGIDKFVDSAQIKQTVDVAVRGLVKDAIDNLVVDETWIKKIETMVNQQMTTRMLDRISGIDLTTLLVGEIDQGIERWQGKLLKQFKTNGIVDTSTQCNLHVSDEAVVITNGLATKSALVEENIEIKGTAIIDNLVVKGVVNTDSKSWGELTNVIADKTVSKLTKDWTESLVEDVLHLAKVQGIDFESIMLDGAPLVEGNILNARVTETSIQSVGTLDRLTVSGQVRLSDDTLATKNKRVGINTADPEMALTVWDEEVSIIAGKLSKNNAYIGTARKQGLSFGINRAQNLQIDIDGTVSLSKLKVDRWQVGFNPDVPGWSGTRGDFIINSDPKPGSAFAWVCLGAFRWQALKAVQ